MCGRTITVVGVNSGHIEAYSATALAWLIHILRAYHRQPFQYTLASFLVAGAMYRLRNKDKSLCPISICSSGKFRKCAA